MREFSSAGSKFDVDYLTCASRLAESLHGENGVEIAEAIALQYVESGQLELGVEQAERIPDVYTRDSVLAVIAAKAVASEREDYAAELVETIEDPVLHNAAIEEMSIEFARSGKFDTALSLVDQLANNASALGAIATAYWQSGLNHEAIELARSIEFAEQSATTLVQLAGLSDERDESLNLLGEARSVAEEIEPAEVKVFALIAIAGAYEGRADREHSLAVLNRAFEVCDDFESANLVGLSAGFARDEALLEILEGLLRLEDLSKATDVADEIEDRFIFARAKLRLAMARGAGREAGEAAKYLDEVRAMTANLEVYGKQEAAVRDGVIIELAMSYASCDNYAEARRIIRSVTSEQKQESAFIELGKLCGTAGYVRGVFEIDGDLGNAYHRARYWLGIYDATSSRHPELSERAMAKALAAAEGLEQPVEKTEALTEIAVRLAKRQSHEAESFFLAATRTATLIEGNFLKAWALLRLAKASQATGRTPDQNERRLLEEIMVQLS